MVAKFEKLTGKAKLHSVTNEWDAWSTTTGGDHNHASSAVHVSSRTITLFDIGQTVVEYIGHIPLRDDDEVIVTGQWVPAGVFVAHALEIPAKNFSVSRMPPMQSPMLGYLCIAIALLMPILTIGFLAIKQFWAYDALAMSVFGALVVGYFGYKMVEDSRRIRQFHDDMAEALTLRARLIEG